MQWGGPTCGEFIVYSLRHQNFLESYWKGTGRYMESVVVLAWHINPARTCNARRETLAITSAHAPVIWVAHLRPYPQPCLLILLQGGR